MNVSSTLFSPTTGDKPAYSGMLAVPQDIAAEPAARMSGLADRWGLFVGRRASSRSLLVVFRQLALLIETGIDIAEAIELVAKSCRQAALQQCLLQILDDINNGTGLGLAVAEQEHMLGHQVVASIRAGEASGRMTDVLRQIAAQLEENQSIRASIIGSLAYPAILCGAAGVVASILVWFVLPQFEESFSSMGVVPPMLTKLLFAVSGFVRGNLAIVGIGSALTAAAIAFAATQPSVKKVFYRLCFQSPVLGHALRNLSVGQLFLSLGHLLGNGIALLEAIQLVKKSTSGGVLGTLVEAWEHDVLEGRGLTYSLEEFQFLPEGADAMLIMAERTGKLESVLVTAGAYYRDEGSLQMRQVLKLSEPLIIIVLGVFVGIVVASVLLPILDVQAGAAG